MRTKESVNILAFDVETAPDLESARRLYALQGLNDADVARVMFEKRRQETGDSDFLRHHLHRIIAISAVLRHAESLRVWSLGDPGATEAELIRRFFDGIERYTPTLVSWNGSQFDLPVLHYRALLHGVSGARYWDTGDQDREFRWNNYLNRYHERHTDLMDVLSGYQGRAAAPLDEVARMLGLPGKLGMSGDSVWEHYQAGRIEEIRNYCEIDALNTYLIYLRWELLRGNLGPEQWQREQQLVRESLKADGRPHLATFLANWQVV